MFSKLLLASAAISHTEAINLKMQALLKGVSETCDYNIQRIESPQEAADFKKYSGGSTPFVDSSFPAEESSLFWRQHLMDSEMPQTFINEVTGWARPSELVGKGKKPNLWGKKGVLPAGTNQGALGDCWFLASAAALAEVPERIMDIFTNKSYDSAGCFQLTFYLAGEPVKITVDDQFPVDEGMDPKYTSFGVKRLENSRMSKNDAWW